MNFREFRHGLWNGREATGVSAVPVRSIPLNAVSRTSVGSTPTIGKHNRPCLPKQTIWDAPCVNSETDCGPVSGSNFREGFAFMILPSRSVADWAGFGMLRLDVVFWGSEQLPEDTTTVRAGGGCNIDVFVAAVVRDLVRCRNIRGSERFVRQFERSGTEVMSKDAEMVDVLHANRKDMQEEAVDERLCAECDGAVAKLDLFRLFRLSASDPNLFAVKGKSAAVANGHPVGVA